MDHALELICAEHGVFLRSRGRGARLPRPRDRASGAGRVSGFAYDAAPTCSAHIYRGLDLAGRYDLLCRAAVRQAPDHGGAQPHQRRSVSGDVRCGTPRLTDGPPDATGRDGGQRREASIRPASRQCWSTGDVVERNGLLVTSATSARRWSTRRSADVEHSLVEIDDLLHAPAGRRWPACGSATPRWPSGRTPSSPTWCCAWLTAAASPWARHGSATWCGPGPASTRGELPDPATRTAVEVARVDLAWPAYGVVPRVRRQGEVRATAARTARRASDVVFREKQREDMICRLTGWRCIRVVWADLYTPAGQTAGRIRAMFRPAAA